MKYLIIILFVACSTQQKQEPKERPFAIAMDSKGNPFYYTKPMWVAFDSVKSWRHNKEIEALIPYEVKNGSKPYIIKSYDAEKMIWNIKYTK